MPATITYEIRSTMSDATLARIVATDETAALTEFARIATPRLTAPEIGSFNDGRVCLRSGFRTYTARRPVSA